MTSLSWFWHSPASRTFVLAASIVLSLSSLSRAQILDSCNDTTIHPPTTAVTASPPGNTEIRLKISAIVGATVAGDTLFISGDRPVKFPLEYINRDSNSYNVSSGFEVYSPDGATWEHATANGGNVRLGGNPMGLWIDTTGFYPKSDFGALYTIGAFNADGAGHDSMRFLGASNDISQLGAHPLDSGIVLYIIIRPKLSDVGKHICIDSLTKIPPCHGWRWPSSSYIPAYNAFPAWGGPYCFVLSGCCRGLSGNYDCDPEDKVDISDVSAFVARYIDPQLPCCPGEANTDGSPDGLSDISDLSRLIDYLFISFTPPEPCR